MTFQTKDGTKFEIGSFSTWSTITGKQITDARVNVFNPKTGHGWSGVMTQTEEVASRAHNPRPPDPQFFGQHHILNEMNPSALTP